MDQIELIDKRKPREKHFLQNDGTIRAEIYDTNIHYLKNGKYEEIDNTLIKENDSLVNKNNDYKVEFHNNQKKSLMKISKESYYIDFKIRNFEINDIKSHKRKISDKYKNVLCSNITDDITIEYKALNNKVKETIILQNANHSELSFELDTNLKLKEKDGKIVAENENNTIIFEIEKPFMYDSNNINNNNLYYKLDVYDGNYILSLILDDEWITEKERVFPVYIDPTITNSTNEITLEETYIYPGDTNDVRYNKEYFKAGIERVNGVDRQNIGLIKFSLPNLGTGSSIVKALLTLTPYSGSLYGEEKLVEIHKINADWNSTTANWDNMQGKFSDRIEATCAFNRSPIYNNTLHLYKYDVDVTTIVKQWYEDNENYGIMIKSCNTNYIDDQYQMYFSSENTVASNPKPIVSITYRNYNGVEPYINYRQHDLTIGKTFINTYNGNVTNIFDIGSTVGGNLPVGVRLVYNTNDVILENETFFGKGLRLNYEEYVLAKDSDTLEYVDEDGTTHIFYKKNDSSLSDNETKYVDEDGLDLTIIKNSSQCTMIDSDGNKKIFSKIDNKFYLTRVEDTLNNYIDVILNDNHSISCIKDKNNKMVSISYNDNTIVISSENDTTTLNYENNLLKSIICKLGTIYLNYNSSSIIESITDTNCLKLLYEYYEKKPYRIKKVSQCAIDDSIGNSYEIKYAYDSTEITDNQGVKEILKFNEYGNLKSKSILKGENKISSAYSSERVFGTGEKKNKVLSNMIPFRYTKNIMKNSSFESDTNNFIAENGITMEFDNTMHRTGSRCLKLTSSVANKTISQDAVVEKGEYYTFSSYFITDIDATISMSYINNNNETITESRKILKSDDFTREEVTIFYGSEAISDLTIKITLNEIGTIYFDDMQLENDEVANNYNMFDNSDFSNGMTGWTTEAYTNDGTPSNIGECMSVVTLNENNDKALKVSMSPLKYTQISKKFDIKGTVDDVFTLSFWYRNEGTMPFEPSSGCTVRINFEPYDTDYGQCLVIVPLSVTGKGIWQHFTHREGPPADFKSITVTFCQYASANDFYLTDLSFYKNMASDDYGYDEFGNIISLSKSGKLSSSFEYDSNNQLIKITTPLGKNFKYEYDKNNPKKLLTAISESGICNEIKYDSNDNPISTKISKKIMTNVEDGKYRIRNKGTKKYLKAEYNNILLEESECSNTLWELESENQICKLKYSVTPEYSISHIDNHILLSNLDSNNQYILDKNTNGSFNIYIYNEMGPKKYLKANDDSTLTFESLIENDISFEFYFEKANELFIETDATYSNDGRYITSTKTTNMSEEIYNVDLISGLRTTLTSKGQTYNYEYNDKNQLISIVNGEKIVKYEYNINNLLSKIDVGNKEYNLEYNKFLKLTKVKIGNSVSLVEKEFDEENQKVTKVKYANGNVINCQYDDFGRPSLINKESNNYHFKYDNNNNLAKVKSDTYCKKYRYDIANRLFEYDFDDMRMNFKYDSDNNIVEKSINLNNNNHNVFKEFNLDNNINKITFDSNEKIEYIFDYLCRPNIKKINNLYQIHYSYKTNGNRATSLIDEIMNDNDILRYNYDEKENIKEVYNNENLIFKYEYDNFNQLITEYDYVRNTKTSYNYDLYGNIISKENKNLSDDNILNTINYNYKNNNWKDQLTSYNSETISYDESGNIVKIGTNINMEWKNGRELSKYIDDRNTINFEYDERGIRTKKIVNGVETKYYLEGNKIIFEKNTDNTIFYMRNSDELIGFKYNEDSYFYIKNAQDDVIGILDSNYNKIVEYTYDAWGNITNIMDNSNNNIGNINSIRYRSYYYDQESNLYYLNNRYYNPLWGRFLTPDDSVGLEGTHIGYNLYAYACNNPINNIDYNGRLSLKILKNVTKAIAKTSVALAKKAVTKAVNNVKKIITPAITCAQNVYNTLSDAFVVEFGSGIGVSAGTQLGFVKAETGWTKKFGTGWDKNGSYQYTTQSFDFVDVEVYGNKFGYSKEITSYDPTMNPMATVYDLARDPDAEVNTVIVMEELPEYTVETETCFVGFSFELYYILGMDFKIGFNL